MKESSLWKNYKKKRVSLWMTAKSFSTMQRFNMKWENTNVWLDIFIIILIYSCREISFPIERDLDLRALNSHRFSSLNLLGSFILRNLTLKRKKHCLEDNLKQTQRIDWQDLEWLTAFPYWCHESKGMVLTLNIGIQFQ